VGPVGGVDLGLAWNPGTVVYKASSAQSTCHDLNLVYANDTSPYGYDWYAGFYRTSDGVWHVGSRGYRLAYDGNVNWLVLLSDVRAGTPMSVGSLADAPDYVTVAHRRRGTDGDPASVIAVP